MGRWQTKRADKLWGTKKKLQKKMWRRRSKQRDVEDSRAGMEAADWAGEVYCARTRTAAKNPYFPMTARRKGRVFRTRSRHGSLEQIAAWPGRLKKG